MKHRLFDIIRHPNRWKRSLGFGVHSPFAFSFITKVINETEAVYYAYPEIDALCPKNKLVGFNEIFAGGDFAIPEAHLLFRTLCRVNPSVVIEIGNGHEVTHVTISRSVPKAKVITWGTGRRSEMPEEGTVFILVNEMLEINYDEIKDLVLDTIANRTAVLFIRNLRNLSEPRRLWDGLIRRAQWGMGFCDEHTGIFFSSPKLPKTVYSLLFPMK